MRLFTGFPRAFGPRNDVEFFDSLKALRQKPEGQDVSGNYASVRYRKVTICARLQMLSTPN